MPFLGRISVPELVTSGIIRQHGEGVEGRRNERKGTRGNLIVRGGRREYLYQQILGGKTVGMVEEKEENAV